MHTIGTEQQGDKYRNHAQVWALLPWLINGSLSAEEKQQISEHAAICLICRKELAAQTALRDFVKHYELEELVVTASFDRLSAKLQAQDAGLQIPASQSERHAGKLADVSKRRAPPQFKPWYFAAAAAALTLAAVLTGITTQRFLGNNTFRTLSNQVTEAPASDLHLIFADGVAEADRHAILIEAGLSIVSGPDERGLYFVNAPHASSSTLAATLARLHRDERILFAEFASASPNNPAPEAR